MSGHLGAHARGIVITFGRLIACHSREVLSCPGEPGNVKEEMDELGEGESPMAGRMLNFCSFS